MESIFFFVYDSIYYLALPALVYCYAYCPSYDNYHYVPPMHDVQTTKTVETVHVVESVPGESYAAE